MPQFVWTSQSHIDRRKRKVSLLLQNIKELKSNIIVFPEYSVPKECHSTFQSFADGNGCVIVAGSYYEYRRDDPLFRNNVCRVYIPHQPPLTIVKKHKYLNEEEALETASGFPNVARLVWTENTGKTFSTSVYICRDYLIPYASDGGPDQISQMDWENVGLNIVVMCSSQATLFEGQAAFDVRRMRGKGKFVALCNCCGTSMEGSQGAGSALLGPTQEYRRKYGDVIEKLPGDEEAILTAEVSLDKVAEIGVLGLIEIKPDKHIYDPLRSVSKSRVRWLASESGVNFDPIIELAVRKRGVWHPAFLDVVGRNIAMELRTTQRYGAVKEAFKKSKIQLVSAVGLVGLHDVMLRYYETMGRDEVLSQQPYSNLGVAEFEKLLPPDKRFKLSVRPDNICKYRTVPVRDSRREWTAKKKQIEELLPRKVDSARRKELLGVICRLARDWNAADVTEAMRREVTPVFFEQPEITPVVGPGAGNNLRQRYVMVLIAGEDEGKCASFERNIIRPWLMSCEKVRSIYRVQVVEGGPEFQFWLDIVADPWEADKLVLELDRRCEETNIEIGTRSMDVMDYLAFQSVEGIENTDLGHEFLAFKAAVAAIDEVALNAVDTGMVRDHYYLAIYCARAWVDQTDLLDGPVWREVRESVSKFYGYLFCGNCVVIEDEKKKYLRYAGTAWHDIYQILEAKCRQILGFHLATTGEREFKKALTNYFRQRVEKDDLMPITENLVRCLLEFYKSQNPEIELAETDMEELRGAFRGKVFKFRNDMVHEDHRLSRLSVRSSDRRGDGEKMSELSTNTQVMLDTLKKVEQQIKQQTPA